MPGPGLELGQSLYCRRHTRDGFPLLVFLRQLLRLRLLTLCALRLAAGLDDLLQLLFYLYRHVWI